MMRPKLCVGLLAGVLFGWVCAVGAVATGAPGADEPGQAATLWKLMRAADVESAQFKAAQWKLTALIGTMSASKRAAAAIEMTDRSAEPAVNAAALEQFGKDPIPVTTIQRILWDSQRPAAQRGLLKTYYSFCRAEAGTAVLSEPMRRQLVDVLAERLANLAGTRVHYGEQRLFTHLVSAVLSRYGRQAESVAEAKGLIKALEKYAEKAGKSDGFGAAIPAWLDLLQTKDTTVNTFGKAVRALGHWEPLVRLKAAAYLGEELASDEKAAQVVLSMLTDPRDEVRAAAARVFAFAKDYRPPTIVPKMVGLLTEDRGVVVQAAAAETLAARAEQASAQVGPLLAVLTSPSRRLGSNRTSSILLVMARLVRFASAAQKRQVLELATMRLTTATAGALGVMKAMGPEAARAVPSIREYRATTDRFRRVYIDRHVLPAILPGESIESG